MERFAELLDRLAYEPGRNNKLRLITEHFRTEPDPERGWALAALTGALSFDAAKPGFIRKAAEARLDPLLFSLSYDFVGDLAETVALVWPAVPGANLVLTIDGELQRLAEKAVSRAAASAVIVVEPTTGRIRAIVSKPSFDPNVMTGHLTQAEEWARVGEEHAIAGASGSHDSASSISSSENSGSSSEPERKAS